MNDRSDTVRKAVALVAAIALLVLLVVAIFDDRTAKPMPPNGDMLGTDSGETFTEYRERADGTLTAAPADEHAFALLTFADSLASEEAAQVLEPVGRVNAMIVDLAPPFALPEPVEGETRTEVFERELGRIGDSLAGIGNVPTPEELDAVVVWDTGDVLREVAEAEQIVTVEVLPPDASWGRFGVRPVRVVG